ncbi:MAG: HAD family phosphatase [Candidatus Altiarchaeota archaeon]
MRYLAAIFDVDGTLVDLMERHWRAFNNICEDRFDIYCPFEDFKEVYGMPAREIFEHILQEGGIDASKVDLEEISVERRKIFKKDLGDVKTLPGVLDLIVYLKKEGVKLAVATSNEKGAGYAILDAADLTKHFPVIVTKNDVVHGKPEPDLFLKAAEKLGEKPDKCVVFEDSIHGVEAAVKAGMSVVAVTTGSNDELQLAKKNPQLIVSSLADSRIYGFFDG